MTNHNGSTLTKSSIIDDQPTINDGLGYRSFCDALLELILDKGTCTPLTIGIFGRWGTGKTSLMKMLKKGLQTLDQSGPATVWFNAWRYEKEDNLWAALLQSILNQQQDEQWGILMRFRFKLRLLRNRVDPQRVSGLLAKYLGRLLVVLVPFILSLAVVQAIASELKSYVVLAGAGVSLLLAIPQLVKPLVEAVKKNVQINFNDFLKKSDYEEHISFLDRFLVHFQDIVMSLPVNNPLRLVVFIDDLDRCDNKSILQVLDAIKLFADVKGCIYVLGLDDDVVRNAIAEKYNTQKTSLEYLEKIIQLPINLPLLTTARMEKYIKELPLEMPDPRCQEVFIKGLAANPRKVKRAINTFSLLWKLAHTREDISKAIQPVRLAKVVLIQHSFPTLNTKIRSTPGLIKDVEEFFQYKENYVLAAFRGAEVSHPFRELAEILSNKLQPNDLNLFSTKLGLEIPDNMGLDARVKSFILNLDANNLYDKFQVANQDSKLKFKCSWNDIFQQIKEEKERAIAAKAKYIPQDILNDPNVEFLSRLLTYNQPHPQSNEQDCCFATLKPEEIQQYFTLTEQAQFSQSMEQPSAPAQTT